MILTNALKSELVYDAKMRRRIRREFTWQGGTWVLTNEVRYVYDANLEIQWRDNLNLPTLTLTRGQDLSGTLEDAGGIGGLLAFSQHSILNPRHAYYYSDGNGNITALIDANQQVVARYLYEAFGKVLSMSGPLAEPNSYRFSSKEEHVPSALVYYLYRYYRPELQRWLNNDPLGDRASLVQPFSIASAGFAVAVEIQDRPNLAMFVHNDPTSTVDTFGLAIYKCSRQARTMRGSNHTYLWDDKSQQSCGRSGGLRARGENAEGDNGPGTSGHSCTKIPGSDGKESAVMACCFEPKWSMFTPGERDCHNWVDDCLKKNGLDAPSHPRFNFIHPDWKRYFDFWKHFRSAGGSRGRS
jgi:RHS repeat-associated protein